MAEYTISPSAIADLREISDYFMFRNVEAGERLFAEFNRKCRNLVAFPRIGRSYSHIAEGLRGLSLQNYILIYQVLGEDIEILRIVDGRQDLRSLFSE